MMACLHKCLWQLCLGLAALVASSCALLAEGSVGTVCRSIGIKGYDTQASFAKTLFRVSSTSDPSKCQIYVTRVGNDIYAHSNFVTPPGLTKDGDLLFPTKLVGNLSQFNLSRICENVLGEQALEIDRVDVHTNQVEYLLDQNLFDNAGGLKLDTVGARKLWLLPGGKSPPLRMQLIYPIRGPPYTVVESRPNVYVRVRGGDDPGRLFKRLEQKQLQIAEMVFASFLSDSAVTKGIQAAVRLRQIDRSPAPQDLTRANLHELLRGSKGKMVILLGHTQGGSFHVTRKRLDGKGYEVVIDMPIKELVQAAEREGCELVFLGCESGLGDAPVGPLVPFNPLEVIHKLENAIHASTAAEFCQRLASAAVPFAVADEAFGVNRGQEVALLFGKESHTRDRVTGEAEVFPPFVSTPRRVRSDVGVGVLVLSLLVPDDQNDVVNANASANPNSVPTWVYVVGGIALIAVFLWAICRPDDFFGDQGGPRASPPSAGNGTRSLDTADRIREIPHGLGSQPSPLRLPPAKRPPGF